MNNLKWGRRIITILLIGLWLIACTRKVANPTQIQETQIGWITKQNAPYQSLDSRFKLHYLSEEEEHNVRIKLRMQKDSIIWVSMTATAGIEVMRTLIKRDSAFIINRLGRSFEKMSFDDLSKKLNFKIDFDLLQSIILGTMPFQNYKKAISKRQDKHLLIKQKVKHIDIDNYLNPQNEQLEQLFMRDSISQNSINLVYENFMTYNGFLFANNRKITVKYKDKIKNQQKKTDISIDHIKVNLSNEKLEFPFRVPRRFDEEDKD